MSDPNDPAHPFTSKDLVGQIEDHRDGIKGYPGLTKRELAAIEIMAAMAAGSMVTLDVCARKAVQAADLLFLELERNP